ncbi:MAG: hypothetical protein GQ564_14775 [Bacteroidales bacterium]|nr:hypothetical protein [Bacteroidales bacterium]
MKYSFLCILFMQMFYLLPVKNSIAQQPDDFIFLIHAVNDSTLFFDLPEYNKNAKSKGGPLQLFSQDNGADRLIKVIPCPENPRFVYLRPMHSEYVLGISDSLPSQNSKIILIERKLSDKRSMFELEPIKGKSETYRIKFGDYYFLSADELILDAPLSLKSKSDKICQEWVFKKADIKTLAPLNILYYLRPLSDKTLSLDISGFHTYAGKLKAEVKLYHDEIPTGADRYVKVLNNKDFPEYISLQPQHSNYVLDVKGGSLNSGAELWLYELGINNAAQMFKPIHVQNGTENYYILQVKRSGLYLTANGHNMPLTQTSLTGANNQKWVFDKADISTMAPPSNSVYAIQNINNKKFFDMGGFGAQALGLESAVQLYDLPISDVADRYYKINGKAEYKTIQPQHGMGVLNVKDGSEEDGALVILKKNNDNNEQNFKFEYAGEPMTFYIVNKKSGKVLAYNDYEKIIQTTKSDQDRKQKWKLHQLPVIYYIPNSHQSFYIKCAYSNKYWDLPGLGMPGAMGFTMNINGLAFQIWSLDIFFDRMFQFKGTRHSWLNIQVQNGGKLVNVQGRSTENGAKIDLYQKHDGGVQRFAIQVTSPTTFVMRTQNWKTVDVAGGHYGTDGAKLLQYDLHYGANQQFQLIYVDGPNKNKPVIFFNTEDFK